MLQSIANRVAILMGVSCLLPVLQMVAAEPVKSQFVTDVVPVLTISSGESCPTNL